MKPRRQERLNSLLKEVISEVITTDVDNPDVHEFTTVTSVEISADMHHAKVYVSVLGSDLDRKKTVDALSQAAGFIGTHAAKKVTMRYFPSLTFKIDTSVDEHLRIEKILKKVHQEEDERREKPSLEE